MARELCSKDFKVLVDEMPHVISAELETSLDKAADMLEAVDSAINDISRELENSQPAVVVRLEVLQLSPSPQQQQDKESPSQAAVAPGQMNGMVKFTKQVSGQSSEQELGEAKSANGSPVHPATAATAATGSGDQSPNGRSTDKGESPGHSSGQPTDAPLVKVKLVADNFHDVMSAVRSDIMASKDALVKLREQAVAAWEGLLQRYGETKQSVPSDTDFWADMKVRDQEGVRRCHDMNKCDVL